MCENCDALEMKRQELMLRALMHPMPCVVCGTDNVACAGSWVPEEREMLAAGGSDTHMPVFAFCLCEECEQNSRKNPKTITQAVLRDIRLKRNTITEEN